MAGKRGSKTHRDNPNVVPDWWSPPGTVKRYCTSCEHWFSSRGTIYCPQCVELMAKGKEARTSRVSAVEEGHLNIRRNHGHSSDDRFSD